MLNICKVRKYMKILADENKLNGCRIETTGQES